jgi:hypothetical protein
MMPCGGIQKGRLAIIQEVANERAMAFERATLFARSKDEAGALAGTGDRILALAMWHLVVEDNDRGQQLRQASPSHSCSTSNNVTTSATGPGRHGRSG